ncbi:hypothetical protein HZB74_03410, partial [Candidatus Saccharibacteria bacterium]|nr:hypothetical protein [Candidatus Saccharibacteria bacterium]
MVGNLDVTGSVAFKKGTDFSTTGTSNNVNFGEVSLVRLTGGSTQTITGIANGRDGEMLTIVNAAAQSAVIANNSGSSSASNVIITGTGANVTLPSGGSITLIYDSVATVWRAVGAAAFSSGSYIQNGTSLQTSANFNIQSASSGSVGGTIQGASGQTERLLLFKDGAGGNLTAINSDGSFVANSYATATTATTSGTGTNTNTVTLSGPAFANGDIILIDNAGQDYYTRITSGGGTSTLTVSPAVTFENARTVTKYVTQNIGASTTDYNDYYRLFQGYFLGGVTVGSGNGTTLSDGNLTTTATTFNLLNSTATTINAFGAASTINLGAAGATVTNPGSLNIRATGTNTLDLDTTGAGTIGLGDTNATTIGIGNSTAATAVTIQGGTSSTAVNIQAAASGNINIGTNAVTGKVLNIGSVGSTNNDTTIHIADSTAAIQTVTIGSTSSTSATTIQGGSTGVTIKSGGSSGSTTAFQIQNAAGTATYFNVNNSGTNNIITIGGSNSGEITSWTATSTLPTTVGFAGPRAATANGYIYMIGSNDGGGTYSSAVYYSKINADGTLGSWSTNSNALPVTQGRHSITAHNGYIYVLGGYSGGVNVATSYYAKLNADGSIGAWQSTTALPAASSYHISAAYNDYMYIVGGGLGTTTYYSRINTDGTLGTWKSTSSLAGARSGLASVIANGYLYILGGSDGSTQTTVFYATLNADGTLGTWTSTTAMTEALQYFSASAANGYIYVVGGFNGSTHSTAVRYAALNANGTIGSWTTATTTLPGTKSGASSAVVNGYIYHLGGGSYASNTAYYASTQRIRVGGALDLVGLGGENLADAENGTGGELTAGNANIVGFLKVRGPAEFSKNLSVDGTFSAAGDVSLGSNNGALRPWATTSGPGANRSESGFATYNGYVYAVGGGGTTSTVYYSKVNANGTLGTWNTTSTLNTARDQVRAVAYGGYLYAIGGSNAGNLTSVEYAKINADGTVGTWATTNSLNTGRSRSASVAINGYLYAIGGAGTATVEYAKINANGTLGSWTATSSLTGGARYGHASVAANGYMYVTGGNNGSETATTQYAQINTNGTLGTWTATTSMNTARGVMSGTIANGYIYAVGGYNSGGLASVEYAPLNSNGTIGTWSNTVSLGTSRYGNGVFALNGYIYSISGSGTTTAEYASTQRISVGGSLDLVGYSGETLADGGYGSGGSLTAGNTNIVGYLQVAGAANIASGLSVGQELSVNGQVLFQN